MKDFDPVGILVQIGLLQCLFYIIQGVLLLLLALLLQSTELLQLSRMVDPQVSCSDWLAVLVSLSSSILLAITVSRVVKKAKKCLDFSSTVYIIHALVSCCWGGLPPLQWWGMNVLGCVITAAESEFLCIRTEMRQASR